MSELVRDAALPGHAGTDGALGRRDRSHGRKGSLLRAEVRRLTSRRFIRVLVLLAALGYIVLVPVVAFTQFAKTSPEVLAQAQAEVERVVAEQQVFYDRCLTEEVPPDAGEGVTPEMWCGGPPSAEMFPVEQFLPKTPFVLADNLAPGAVTVAVASAALMFLVAATYVGAEWSTRSMVALLFWEPRRLRVMAVKTAVAAAACVVVAVVAQLAWLGSAVVMARLLGTTSGLPPGFWGDTLALQGRAVLMVVLLGLLGFALANLVRNTGAAFGIAFAWFVVLENAVRAARPAWGVGLITENASALVVQGGITVYVWNEGYVDPETGNYVDTGREILVSNLHGGLVLAGLTLATLALGTSLFKRRDLN